MDAAALLAELEEAAQIFIGGEDGGLDPGLFDVVDIDLVGEVDWVVEFDDLAVGLVDFVDDGWRGRDEVEVEFAEQAFLDDFHVEEAEESAAETHAEGLGAFGFVMQRGIVEAEFAK